MKKYKIDLNKFDSNNRQIIEINNKRICIAYEDNKYYAFDAICPHQNVSLYDSIIEDTTLTCLGHGYEFSLVDGKCQYPKVDSLKLYKIERYNDGVYLLLGYE